jgi:hypothetical protein
MTSPKSILSAGFAGTVAVLLLVGTVLASQTGPGYLAVQSFAAAANNANSVRLSATTDGAIPRQSDAFIGSELIVGIAWADLDTGTALVATIHPLLGRDSRQRPDAWHLHSVQLGGGATAPNDFCLVSVLSTPTAGIQISGSTIEVNLPAWQMPVSGGSLVSADDIDAAVGFTVHSGDAGCATGLAVRIST